MRPSRLEGRCRVVVLVVAVASNLGQYLHTGSPMFGGMSGVVYGLFGYVWMKSRYDPGAGMYLHRYTVVVMLVWFVACYTNLLGSIANTAHAVGLGATKVVRIRRGDALVRSTTRSSPPSRTSSVLFESGVAA